MRSKHKPSSMHKIDIGNEFYHSPVGASDNHGKWNGKRFCNEILVPALQEHYVVELDFTNVTAFSPSFIRSMICGLYDANISEDTKKTIFDRLVFSGIGGSLFRRIRWKQSLQVAKQEYYNRINDE